MGYFTKKSFPNETTRHLLNNNLLLGPFPKGLEEAYFGMGCFWGAERLFWNLDGVYITSVGYAGGNFSDPTYEQVCQGITDHAEIVQVVYDPKVIPFPQLLKIFWENHDPTQGDRQGNDRGSNYRSAIYTTTQEQAQKAQESKKMYELLLMAKHFPPITTEIKPLDNYYLAEDYHQQYLISNPGGYCGLKENGVSCPIGKM